MRDELSLDMDEDDDFDSDESSKDHPKNTININDSSFTTDNIINYGKEYEKLEKIYSKKEIALFNKLLEWRKINKLNGELDLDSYKKEKINWKYLYNNVFKLILFPINLNKIDINKTINIHEISQRIKYCVHCISSMKDKNINNEKKNIIPKIIDIFSNDNKKQKDIADMTNNLENNYMINKNGLKRAASYENVIFEENEANKNDNKNESKKNTLKLKNSRIIKTSKIKKHIDYKPNNDNMNNINNNPINNNNTENQNNGGGKIIRKNKAYVTINLGSNNLFKNKFFSPVKNKTKKNFLMEKKNNANNNIIRNIPKFSDDILFETKKKKSKVSYKREAFDEIMNDFNAKNLNIDIKDKTFCENFYFFPLKQNYDNENDLEKRGEKILSYKKMADNLIDILNI